MSHFAQVENNLVVRVLTCEDDLDAAKAFLARQGGVWVQCSYNTHGGVHTGNGVPLRKNYPGPGWTYDAVRDAFIPPKPPDVDGYGAWTLDEKTCLWTPPAGWKSSL